MNLESYISGYVDGEGCFCISIRPRKGNKTGWEVVASFSVSQNEDRAEVLRLIKEYFKCGFIRRNVGDKTLKYETRNLNALLTKIIPHFKNYPLQSGKQKDFEIFKKVCQKMNKGEHLTKEGIIEISELVSKMNFSGKRHYNKIAILNSLNKMKI
ncbi:endonuclease [bacterium (Candidatus Gribaldobacteria) CG10_big_fil_rev_8_21_14_0_10_37_46]|uniref:Endonuclease n=1 Tax=bacterium (Candidatus Gribaldobacteria) CG10_big_fil_rev_8_21_14_0_10_37_46 TaxID=2014276 RepID=A0A2H0UYM7_9BACT|nr:MAG: endonuclease [bacterium (Candidatus Gribaldobacteria) CG10_big_fil_rev_8_21_14_0_10_37_46]